jgi:hypothetical protein
MLVCRLIVLGIDTGDSKNTQIRSQERCHRFFRTTMSRGYLRPINAINYRVNHRNLFTQTAEKSASLSSRKRLNKIPIQGERLPTSSIPSFQSSLDP